jgi:outer membrane lipoprotein carrier protein
MRQVSRWLVGLCWLGLSVNAQAVASLDQVLGDFRSMDADFIQRTTDLEYYNWTQVKGRILVQRPDKMRLSVTSPISQQIVADGQYLWIIDSDLKQATTYKQQEALENTPMVLLMQPERLRTDFNSRIEVKSNNEPWYVLESLNPQSPFNRVELKIRNDRIQEVLVYQRNKNEEVKFMFDYSSYNVEIDEAAFAVQVGPDMDRLGEGQ